MSVPNLDPQIVDFLKQVEESGVPGVEELTPAQARENTRNAAAALFGPVDELSSVEDRDADGVPVRIYRPLAPARPSPALVFLHGGGFVVGSIDTHDGLARALAKRAGCVVISVEYRLAPEHPYPAALEDSWTAASWVLAKSEELGLDAGRIGVGGDSAGGGLATIVARKGRDANTHFAAQLLLYPTITSSGDTPSYSVFSTGYGLTSVGMAWFWKQYLGDTDGGSDPDISPSALLDLRDLPPAIVVTAEADILRDEAEAYAEQLSLAGVETKLSRYDGMIHGFLRMATVDRVRDALDEIAASLAAALAKGRRDAADALTGR